MKSVIGIIIIAFLLSFGCTSNPIIEEEVTKLVLPEGCVKTTYLAGDEYYYQSVVEPRVIDMEWIELEELRWGNYMEAAFYYRNPDPSSNIPVASLLVQFDALVAFAYLIDGELEVFHFINTCYEKVEITAEQAKELKQQLTMALGWKES